MTGETLIVWLSVGRTTRVDALKPDLMQYATSPDAFWIRTVPHCHSRAEILHVQISDLYVAQLKPILRLVDRGQVYSKEVVSLALVFEFTLLECLAATFAAEVAMLFALAPSSTRVTQALRLPTLLTMSSFDFTT